MQQILSHFPQLSAQQRSQFEQLFDLYKDWNSKINVISRKDIDNLYLHHVLHSLAIAKFTQFTDGSSIMDVGTGGGFPGIPLAIMFPNVNFLLLDSIGKKIKVATEVAQAIGLTNVMFNHSRMENETRKFDFIVSRAVMTLPELVKLVRKNVRKEQQNGLPNGMIVLKGGDLTEEVKPYKRMAEIVSLTEFFDEPFFETKKLVYLPIV